MIFLYYLLSASICLYTDFFIYGWAATMVIVILGYYFFQIPLNESAACMSGSILAINFKDDTNGWILPLFFNVLVYSIIWLMGYSTDVLLITTFLLAGTTRRVVNYYLTWKNS